MSESRMKQNGFTLIELIVTIIILGILAVVIAPRFSSSESYQEHSYRAQAISLIRAVQLRAMQQTDNSFNCHAVNIASDEISSDDTAPCNVNVLSVPIENGDDVTFELDGGTGSIGFDTFGVPQGDCSGGCLITINGVDNLSIQIESQGYVHAI